MRIKKICDHFTSSPITEHTDTQLSTTYLPSLDHNLSSARIRLAVVIYILSNCHTEKE